MDNKLIKILGLQRAAELSGKSVEQLKEMIVVASRQKEEAKRELAANDEYIRLKESLKAVSGSVRDLNKELNAVIKASVQLLEDKGAV